MSKVSYVLVVGIDHNGCRESVAEILLPTILSARDTMRTLVGGTTKDALAFASAEPDNLGYDDAFADHPIRGFTIATYDQDEGTIAELDFNAEGKAVLVTQQRTV